MSVFKGEAAALSPALFRPEAVPAAVAAQNDKIVQMMEGVPTWLEMGAQAFRDAVAAGTGPRIIPPRSPRARTEQVKGRAGRTVPIRVLTPEPPVAPSGIYLHMHGGGWVLGGADQNDPRLEEIARNTGLIVVSVEYRLAPEHPYPAAPDDCEDVAAWLVEHAKAVFGVDRLAIGGDSAGAHLAAVTLIRMRDRHGYAGFKGANLVFGCYDMAMTPSVRNFGALRLGLRTIDMAQFIEAFVPDPATRADPDVSPIHADLHGLPPALFTVGTRDLLLDDSLFMHARWIAAGNEARLSIWPGGPHGFQTFHPELGVKSFAEMDEFLAACARA